MVSEEGKNPVQNTKHNESSGYTKQNGSIPVKHCTSQPDQSLWNVGCCGCETEAYESWTHTSLPHPETTATKAEPATENVHDVMVLRENVTAPENVHNVTVLRQNETSITLEWSTVDDILTYRIKYIESGNPNPTEEKVNGSVGQTSVEHEVSNLTSGTTYNFTVFTVSGNVISSGFDFTAVTAPENVHNVMVLWQNETSITLEWSKVDDILTYRIKYIESGNPNPTEEKVNGSVGQTSVEHEVSNLTSGTTYNFTLFTVSGNVNSSGFDFTAVTAPENVHNMTVLWQNETSITLEWSKVDDILTYRIQYIESGNPNPTEEEVNGSVGQTSVEHEVSNLTSGTTYNFTLFTVSGNVSSSGFDFTAVTAPNNALDFKAVDQSETSITLQWSKVNNISKYVLKFNGNETAVNASEFDSGGSESVELPVSSLMIGTLYKFTLLTVFENVNSSGENISAATAPRMVDHFKAVGQTETSITLQWRKVNKSYYVLDFNGSQRNLTAVDESELFTYEVSPLHATNEYDFIVFTVLNNVSSTGQTISAVTAPSNVPRVVSTKRFLTNVTLQWIKVHENTTYILEINGRSILLHNQISVVTSGELTYTVEHLKPGTEYNYTLYTVFKEVNSSGFEDVTVTVINCTASHWIFDNSSIKATIEGVFSYGNTTNGSGTHQSPGGSNVSFTGLYPGSTYEVSLWYRAEGLSESYLQCEHSITIIPPDIQVHCDQGAAAYAIFLSWDVPEGRWTQVEVNVTGDHYTVGQNNELTATIPRLQPAKTYKVSAVFAVQFTESGILRKLQSKVAETTCSTYTGGVVAGSVMAVLLFCLLVCLAVFIWRRKPDIFRKKPSYMGSSKRSSVKFNDIPVEKFPDYFYEMSRDEDRAFIEEYERFFPVGTEQTQKTADLPENRPKNRFTNVLPYDWSRVKLSTIQHDETSDYINACYMPGYGSTRQYIAAQGPLPSTVNEFWRMIWEQRVKGVVMVTNCTEGGRVKCDQYWPLDSTPCRYGDLIVTINSENRETNWTIRTFGVKHMETSEERTVKQFHFTAWPDHGVPEGTEALIQFRGLVRQHIESEGARSPTVVHCSAGVGRTGTIIALDVLLQQLEQEGKVGVASFVHKMRLSRPLMVQTESQYTFLHQCMLNFLESKSRPDENIYENAEMIYENATALKEFHQSNKTNV